MKGRKKETGGGLLGKMLADLGIAREDFQAPPTTHFNGGPIHRGQFNLAGPFTQGVLQLALPIVTTLDQGHVGPKLRSPWWQAWAQPDRVSIVLGGGEGASASRLSVVIS